MIDGNDVQNGTKDGQDAGVDPIARLLRAAGPRPDAPAERTGRVRDAVHARWRLFVSARRRSRRLAWGAVPLAAAAVWAILVASGAWRTIRTAPPAPPIALLERSAGSVSWSNQGAPAVGAALDAGTSLDTGADGRVALRLGGGASVRLDVGSRARLVSATELALDRGSVYVDTGGARRRETGMAIRTSLGTVREVGTQFQVRVSGDDVRLSVRQGAASLERRGLSHAAPSGMQLTVRGDGTVTSRSVPLFGPEWDWIQDATPPFDLEGRRLGEYLDWIGRETGLQIHYADPAIAAEMPDVILHGSVEGLRPGETLAAVLPTCGLRHRVSGGSVIIERATPAAPGED